VEHAIAQGKGAEMNVLGRAPLEQQLAAYETTDKSARSQAKSIQMARRREASGHGDNSVRSVRRIIENTPASYWIRILDESLRQVQSHLKHDAHGMRVEHDPDMGLSRHDFCCLVADAYYHGWLVSTGMRISETAHVRLDLQYSDELRAKRESHLRAVDRKETPNTLPHECMVRERYVPLWLEQLFLEQARPFFMREWRPRARGRGRASRSSTSGSSSMPRADRTGARRKRRMARVEMRWLSTPDCSTFGAAGRPVPHALPRASAESSLLSRVSMRTTPFVLPWAIRSGRNSD
jgi:hypothetical protein